MVAFALAASVGCSGSGGGGGGGGGAASAASTVSQTPGATTTGPATQAATSTTAGTSLLQQLLGAPVSTGATQPATTIHSTVAPAPSVSAGSQVGSAIGQAVGSFFGGLISQAIMAPKLGALGQALYYDKILSGNKDIACSTCHNTGNSLSDGLSLSLGTGSTGVGPNRVLANGNIDSRNAPTTFDTGSSTYGGSSLSFFWDSRVTFSPLTTPDPNLNDNPSLASYKQIAAVLGSPMAAQAMFPPVDTLEMKGQPGSNEIANAPNNIVAWQLIMARLIGTNNGTVGGIPAYRNLFSAAYPGVAFDDMNFGYAAQALASFVGQNFSADNTPYDDYTNNGNTNALTASQVNGMNIFNGVARCSQCHSGTSFSDFAPHGMAVPQIGPGRLEPNDDRGVALVTNNTADNYHFRTPSLRNVAITGPWMHDGCYTTLAAAVQHELDPTGAFNSYDPTQLAPVFQSTVDTNPTRQAARVAAVDPIVSSPVTLSASDFNDLLNFLGALTDPSSVSTAQASKPSSVPSGLPID
jgi:cytochrome c peroxidase